MVIEWPFICTINFDQQSKQHYHLFGEPMVIKQYLFLILINLSLPGKAADRTSIPEYDWTQMGGVDFCPNTNNFDFRNAYWMGALSTYSYWHLTYTDQIVKTPVDQPVWIQFKQDAEGNKLKQTNYITKGLGFANIASRYFTSEVSKPESGIYSNLTRRFVPPLPEVACRKQEKHKCFNYQTGSFGQPPELLHECGEYNELAYLDKTRLQNIVRLVNGETLSSEAEVLAMKDKSYIERETNFYEKGFFTKLLRNGQEVDIRLDWKDPYINSRCDAYNKKRDKLIPDTQGAIFESDEAIIIVFRGTESGNSTDLATDLLSREKVNLATVANDVNDQTKILNSYPWKGAKGSVHKGFYAAASIARAWVSKNLNVLRRQALANGKPEALKKPIFITGHSLGGAIANLITYNLLRVNKIKKEINSNKKNRSEFVPYNVKALYTFGSPRVGDVEWAHSMKEMADQADVGLFRIVNGNDLVTHIPCFNGYSHVGTLVQLEEVHPFLNFSEKELIVRINPKEKTLLNKASSLIYPHYNSCAYGTAIRKPKEILALLMDHFMTSYYSKLSSLRAHIHNNIFESLTTSLQSGKNHEESLERFEYPKSCDLKFKLDSDELLKINSQKHEIEVEGEY